MNFGDKATSVEHQSVSEVIPQEFSLKQNYPNPFNPSTSITFDVAASNPVTIKIYNTLGQVVATLVDHRIYSPGTYKVEWNASMLSSGVYFYTLESNNIFVSKKMVLLK